MLIKNKYIRNYVPSDLKWCERDGLLTYIDQLKYSEFMFDPDDNLKKAKVIHFDMIYKSIKWDQRQQEFSDRY